MGLNHAPTVRMPRWLLFAITIFLVIFYFYFTRPQDEDSDPSQSGR